MDQTCVEELSFRVEKNRKGGPVCQEVIEHKMKGAGTSCKEKACSLNIGDYMES
jgi:hypothetical protein